eukprot:4204607-Prymnesium_polylepis.1
MAPPLAADSPCRSRWLAGEMRPPSQPHASSALHASTPDLGGCSRQYSQVNRMTFARCAIAALAPRLFASKGRSHGPVVSPSRHRHWSIHPIDRPPLAAQLVSSVLIALPSLPSPPPPDLILRHYVLAPPPPDPAPAQPLPHSPAAQRCHPLSSPWHRAR